MTRLYYNIVTKTKQGVKDMRQVTINVYEFKELSESVQTKLKESESEQILEERFEVFGDYLSEYLHKEYGIADSEFGYSLSYNQGDGLHFNTKQFLTDKTEKLILEKLKTEVQKEVLAYLVKEKVRFICKSFVMHYEYASREDLFIEDSTGVAEDIAESTDISLQNANLALQTITEVARNIYVDICSKLEQDGYRQYDITDEEIAERLDSYLYYEDGRIYAEKEE